MGRKFMLTLLYLIFIIGHKNVVGHIGISLTQPPESRISSQFPSTSPTHNTMSFDTSALAIPPTIGRRLKMAPFQAFSDSTGGAESQAPSPDAGEAEAPSPDGAISPTIGRRLLMAPFQAFSDSTGGAESQAPSPHGGETEANTPAVSPTIGRRLKMELFQAFSDSTGGAEPQAPSPDGREAQAPSPDGDDTNTLAIPPTGRRLKTLPFSGFLDSTGGAESQGHADGDQTSEEATSADGGNAAGDGGVEEAQSPAARDSISDEAMSAGGSDAGAAEAPSPGSGDFAEDSTSEEATSMDGGDAFGDAEASSPVSGDYAAEDAGAADTPSSADGGDAPVEPPSSIDDSDTKVVGAENPEFLFGHRLPFDFDKFPGDVHPLIANGANRELKSICDKTESPDLCIAAVAPFLDPAAHVAIQKVLEVSIHVNSAFAKHILALIKKLALTPRTPRAAREVLNDCRNSYKGVVSSYQSAIIALGKKDLGRVNFTLNAVLEDSGDCEDEFKGLDFKCSVAGMAEKLIRMTKNSMAVGAVETNGKNVGGKGEAPAA